MKQASDDKKDALRRFIFNPATILLLLFVALPKSAGGWPPAYPRTEIFPRTMLFPTVAACSTGNSTPVTDCTDWLTGPASSENSQLQMYYGDPLKKPWLQGALVETDIGRPVMSPDGQKLELMLFGDTFVENAKFPLQAHRQYVRNCMTSAEDVTCGNLYPKNSDDYTQCLGYFTTIQPKANACTYIFAPFRRQAVFDDRNNVTIFEAEIEPSSDYRIKFKSHLFNKMVRHGPQEGVAANGTKWFTGVYGIDYFYTCPGSSAKCEDSDMLLQLATQTVFWNPISASPSDAEKLHTKLSREGMGFYQFGKLDNTKNATEGCRYRYGASYAHPGAIADRSCPGSTSSWVQPKHLHETLAGVVKRPDNVHVFWGGGSKFSFAIVAHGYSDPYDAGRPGSSGYIYFIGSGETDSKNQPTGSVYMARLPASESALIKGQFEYFKGRNANGDSLWGNYADAVPILKTLAYPFIGPPVVTSFTKRFGGYYLAATCHYNPLNLMPAYGMCTAFSKDGVSWTNSEFALYSDIVLPDISPVALRGVYGHMWVPEALYPSPEGIAYLFSVWKSPKGYFRDFYRSGGPASQIKAEHLFYSYNPKMFLYRPTSVR